MSSRTDSSQRSTSSVTKLRQDNNRDLRARLVEMAGPCPKVHRNARTHMCCSVVEGQNGDIGPNFGAWQLLKQGSRGGFYYVNLTEPLSRDVIAGDAQLQSLLRRRQELQVRSSPNSSPLRQRRGTRASPRRRAPDTSSTQETGKRKLDSYPDPSTVEGSPSKARRVEVVITAQSTAAKPGIPSNTGNLPVTARPGSVVVGTGRLFGPGGIMERTRSATRARLIAEHRSARLAMQRNTPVSPTPVHTVHADAEATASPAVTAAEPLFATVAATAPAGPVPALKEVNSGTIGSPDNTTATQQRSSAPTAHRNPESQVVLDATTTTTPPEPAIPNADDANSFIALHRKTVRELTSHMEAYAAVVEGTATPREAGLRAPGWAQGRIREYLRRALKQYLDTRRYVILTSVTDISNGGRGYLVPFRSNGFFSLSDVSGLLVREYEVRRQTHIVYLVSHSTERLMRFDTLLDVQQGDLLIFRFERLPASSPIPVCSDSE